MTVWLRPENADKTEWSKIPAQTPTLPVDLVAKPLRGGEGWDVYLDLTDEEREKIARGAKLRVAVRGGSGAAWMEVQVLDP